MGRSTYLTERDLIEDVRAGSERALDDCLRRWFRYGDGELLDGLGRVFYPALEGIGCAALYSAWSPYEETATEDVRSRISRLFYEAARVTGDVRTAYKVARGQSGLGDMALRLVDHWSSFDKVSLTDFSPNQNRMALPSSFAIRFKSSMTLEEQGWLAYYVGAISLLEWDERPTNYKDFLIQTRCLLKGLVETSQVSKEFSRRRWVLPFLRRLREQRNILKGSKYLYMVDGAFPLPQSLPPFRLSCPKERSMEEAVKRLIQNQCGGSDRGGFSQMAAPLRVRRDYCSIGRATFLVEQLPPGAFQVFDGSD